MTDVTNIDRYALLSLGEPNTPSELALALAVVVRMAVSPDDHLDLAEMLGLTA